MPTPPSVKVTFTNRQFVILIRVVIEDALVLMHLLQTVCTNRIARRAGGMDQPLVSGVIKVAGLRYGHMVGQNAHIPLYDDDIDEIEFR